MATIPIGRTFRVWSMFVDANGSPLTSLSPAPVFTLYTPSGATLVNAQTMTQFGSTAFWYYDVPADTTTVSGGHPASATCADADVANNPTVEVVQISEYNLDTIQSKTDLITANAITVTSPVNAETLALTVIRGDDYTDAAGRALTWESDDWTGYDLLTASAITFKTYRVAGETPFTKTMSAVDATTVKLQLTDSETGAFSVGTRNYLYDVELTMDSGDIVTLAQGRMTVLADVR